jgi:hypothetical protein
VHNAKIARRMELRLLLCPGRPLAELFVRLAAAAVKVEPSLVGRVSLRFFIPLAPRGLT